jgi:hypothetical protein
MIDFSLNNTVDRLPLAKIDVPPPAFTLTAVRASEVPRYEKAVPGISREISFTISEQHR